ncbi:hypothetical protein Glove_138g30 [Diversispora epigaea]|uniref:Uncharacterized protein n=1 Tax=Diversispora epigaea TaxID=1348612 RepID=A0A397J5Z0_9GLOM|nr:hypothetical protein Glove_138g30 [Diversispora epigaea]
MTRKLPKSTYYNKYGPNGLFTKAAKNNMKITFFTNETANNQIDELQEINSEKNELWKPENINEKIDILKNELINCSDINIEYNKKHAIFEYLKHLDNNGKGKLKASKEAVQLIFLESISHKSYLIRKWAKYWLKYNTLPLSLRRKHQKIFRLVDDEDIVNKCHIWIKMQGESITPVKFKEYIENSLLIDCNILYLPPKFEI